jgi:hypothetical protein
MKRSLSAVTAICILAGATPVAANGPCQTFVAIGSTDATGPNSFAGGATTNLGPAKVAVAVVGLKPNNDGSFNASTAHTFIVFPSGAEAFSFTTRDNARLTPLNSAGLYELNTQASLGEGAWGSARIDGMVDFASGWAKWLATGELCRK